jgi:hypothetical protein
VERAELESWVDDYVGAWTSNDPEDIGRLFTVDAHYYTAPHREPWTGRDGIVAEWVQRKDEPGQWTFRYEVLAVCEDLGFVRGWTGYPAEPANYSNLWVIRLASDGRCSEFTEWWMEQS